VGKRENLFVRKGEKGSCDLYLLESATYTYHPPNRVIILFTPVGSLADSREWCNSADVNTFLLERWELVSCLRPPWWLFKEVH
jgi:hypothetical protein